MEPELMDEGRETPQYIGVDSSIVGHDMAVYTIYDSAGNAILQTTDRMEAIMCGGSRMEH
jgi:hypothetical protein